MDWQSTIAHIRRKGLSQVQIAAHCACGQATISELERGVNNNPKFKLAQALIALNKASDKEIARIKGQLEAKAA